MYMQGAIGALKALNIDNELIESIMPERSSWSRRAAWMFPGLKGYGSWWRTEGFTEDIATDEFKRRAPGLRNSKVMASFIRQIEGGWGDLSQEAREKIKNTLKKAWPEGYEKAQGDIRDSFVNLKTAGADVSNVFRNDLVNATKDAANNLRNFVPGSMPGKPQSAAGLGGKLTFGNTSDPITTNAIGGYVQSSGIAIVHSGEHIVPARVKQPYRDGGRSGGQSEGITVHGGIHIHPPKGSAMAENPKEFGRAVMAYITKEVRRQRERR
jgi:hypothetical protein